MWKPSSEFAGAALVLTLLLGGGCSSVSERPVGPASVDVSPALRERYHQAIEAMKTGQWPVAIDGLESITRDAPALSGPYLNLGIAYAQTGEREKAMTALQASLARKPDNPVAYNQLGILYRQAGRFADARDMYHKALEADPTCADAEWNLGVLNDFYLQQPAEAQRHYERYRQLAGAATGPTQAAIAGTQQLTTGVRQP
jgi:tetratricopeptide (TPR) repeat protein